MTLAFLLRLELGDAQMRLALGSSRDEISVREEGKEKKTLAVSADLLWKQMSILSRNHRDT